MAVVDWTEISANYNWFQEQFNRLAEKRKTIMDMVEKENKEIAVMEEEARKLILTDDTNSKQNEINKRKTEAEGFYKEANDLLVKKEEQLIMESKRRIMEAVKDIAVRDGIGVVFTKEQVLYAAESYYANMTERVLRKLNEEIKK
ncbi:MAG TPA: OmpH family outer membrane protein [bacterium]|nr:OmpH family outer membrane protein [bacterium]HPN32156.1 OmpH family outer membrane protein [bacterium]